MFLGKMISPGIVVGCSFFRKKTDRLVGHSKIHGSGGIPKPRGRVSMKSSIRLSNFTNKIEWMSLKVFCHLLDIMKDAYV